MRTRGWNGRALGAGLWAMVWLAGTGPALAWGPQGHRVVAVIAQANLTPAAREQVAALLGPMDSLAAESSWADDTRNDFSETGPWHYIDIPLDANSINLARDCPQGNCVIGKIEEYERVLKDSHTSEASRRLALRFLIHFVGDLHQPLHCEDNHDKGGNEVQVNFFGQPSNLHSVWDSGILGKIQPYGNKLADLLNSRITPVEKTQWSKGTLADWAMEGHNIARDVAYKNLPSGSPAELGQAYVDAATPVVETQLEKAGIRLAVILNRLLP